MSVNTLDRYGNHFQMSILRTIIEDPMFYHCVRDILKAEYFTFDFARIPYKFINKYYEKYKTVPSFDVLESLISSKYSHKEYERNIILTKIQVIRDESKTQQNDIYIKDETIKFCKQQLFLLAVEESKLALTQLQENPSFDLDFSKFIQKFSDIKNINVQPLAGDVIDSIDDGDELRENIISTSLKMYDYILGGGPAAGELHTLAAYTNTGKTRFVSTLGAGLYMGGANVLHITTEDSKKKIENYYKSAISGVPYKLLNQYKEIVRRELLKYTGKAYIINFPMMKHSVDDIESYYLRMLDNNKKIDIVIVDSPLHLYSSIKTDAERFRIGHVWKALRGFLQMYKLPGFATAQLGKSAANKHDNGTENVAEALQIAQDSDSFTTINRKKTDLALGIAMMHNSKTRETTPGETWKVFINAANGRITEDEEYVNGRIIEMQARDIQASKQMEQEFKQQAAQLLIEANKNV